jgi:hypothetical protein
MIPSTGLSSSMPLGGASKFVLVIVILYFLSSGVEGANQTAIGTQKWAFETAGGVHSSRSRMPA